jgi:two-component system sensor histidine kinase KdpD
MSDDVATRSSRADRGARGRLVTYLGTAPGVGKTYRMLADGWSRAQAGEGEVIGWVERHGRAATREQALRLEIVPPRTVTYHGVEFEDLDVPAVIERRPDVVHVDLQDGLGHPHERVDRSREMAEDVGARIERSAVRMRQTR